MRAIPPIEAIMNPSTKTVDSKTPIVDVLRQLQARGFRHAPVTENGRLVGIVSERDLLAHQAQRSKAEERSGNVGEVCVRDVYVVSQDTPCDQVMDYMTLKHIGSALVHHENKLVGIVTVTDICRSFSDFLKHQYADPAKPWVLRY